MKTDSIFFRIFQTYLGILFELLGASSELGDCYEFQSVEVKQTRVYRDAMDEERVEGQIEEAQSLILLQLARRFGPVDQATKSQIRSLPLSWLEDLGERCWSLVSLLT